MENPSWVNRSEYPFRSQYFNLPAGRMHYVDEGKGEPIVFVHGTPVWSFVYRKFIREFAQTHRCVTPDHLDFGLSDKPENADHSVAAQANRLEQFPEKWQQIFKRPTVKMLDCGHFIQEEKPEDAIEAMKLFLKT
jgi:pimeloyl-ACP methyl ester carboxylesterase